MDANTLAKYIDHTVLKPNMLMDDALKVGKEVNDHGFASACIPSAYLEFLKENFPDITLCTVISFPFGYDASDSKVHACLDAIKAGADELDLVVNISKVKSGLWQDVIDEFQAVNDAVHQQGKLVKWIFENSFLNELEMLKLCEVCNTTKPDFAKTSTGFGAHGARLEDVDLMHKNLDESIRIKASGGIKTFQDAMAYINIGASRIGTSSGVKLINA